MELGLKQNDACGLPVSRQKQGAGKDYSPAKHRGGKRKTQRETRDPGSRERCEITGDSSHVEFFCLLTRKF